MTTVLFWVFTFAAVILGVLGMYYVGSNRDVFGGLCFIVAILCVFFEHLTSKLDEIKNANRQGFRKQKTN